MKLSFTTMATPNLDHKGAIALARRFGFDGVDLRCGGKQGELHIESTDEEINDIAGAFRDAGIKIPSLLCYNTIDGARHSVTPDAAEEIGRLREIAERLGADAIRLFGGDVRKSRDSERLLRSLAEVVRAVLERPPHSPYVYLQNHKPSFTARLSVRLAKLVAHDKFRLVFSPDHSVMMGEAKFNDLLDEVLPWTREIYLSDVSNLKGDATLPGRGIVPLAEVVQFFSERRFEGYYSFKWEKIWQREIAAAETALPRYVEFMRSISG